MSLFAIIEIYLPIIFALILLVISALNTNYWQPLQKKYFYDTLWLLSTVVAVFIYLHFAIFVYPYVSDNIILSTELLNPAFQSMGFLDSLDSYQSFKKIFNFPFVFDLRLDSISVFFVLLTNIILPLCFLLVRHIKTNQWLLICCLFLTQGFLNLAFTANNLLLFYIAFEFTLIPIYIIIGLWGSRDRRLKAGLYLFLYTIFGSIFILFALLYIYTFYKGSGSPFDFQNLTILFQQLSNDNYQYTVNFFDDYALYIIWFCFFIGFAVKIPMIPFHVWLPEAHVEAPTVGSVILAALLLKLGGYGFIRVSVSMFPLEIIEYFTPFVYTMALVSIWYASLIAIRQLDMKRIIAYSSIAHMNFAVLAIFSLNLVGLSGGYFLMIGHGVVSAALFMLIGCLYDRYHSRLIYYYGGLSQVMPVFTSIFFFFIVANMSFPLTCNFIGELLCLVGTFQQSYITCILAALSTVLTTVYSLLLFNRICFGDLKTNYISEFSDIIPSSLSNKNNMNVFEVFLLTVLIVLTIYWGIFPNQILLSLHF